MKNFFFFFLLLAFSCTTAPEDDADKLTLADSLAGKTFALRFFPVNQGDDAVRAVATRFTNSGITLDFNADGTFLHRSGMNLDSGKWELDGDTLRWANNAYQFKPTGERLFLIDSMFQIELVDAY